MLPAGGGGGRLRRGLAFEGRRLPVCWTGSERENKNTSAGSARGAQQRSPEGGGGESITGRCAAQPQARQGAMGGNYGLGGLSRGIRTRQQPQELR